MKIQQSVGIVLLIGFSVSNVIASEAFDYCNDMYPAESYEQSERGFYIKECLEAYSSSDDEIEEAQPSDEEGAFDGSVNEFMDTIPSEENSEGNEY